ncbi:hypothetical protein BGZ95_005747 [Linnemannia exigua]|uniref:Uncharacterized protein n=1 Tax=Linnemannia exigua TaxID=604196 RepID=A0AAD4H8J7_9FUNG|nr:hypothetical protein BGZ95_005747 [Linnemannia exigua]
MRRPSLALFATAVGASILLSSTNNSANAAPISRSPSSQSHNQQQQQEAVVVGRTQIKSRSRYPAPTSATASTSSHKHHHNKKHSKKHVASSASSSSSSQRPHTRSFPHTEVYKFLIPEETPSSAWYPNQRRSTNTLASNLRLQGHAVLDDEDDDAGNELLDTELDSGLERPDDDDTIEGEILEEEDADDFDPEQADDDDEGVEGHLLQHTLRAANTAANARAAAAAARNSESLDWMKENGIQDRDLLEDEGFEDGEEVGEEEVVKVIFSRFGGRAAAAEMAASAGEP